MLLFGSGKRLDRLRRLRLADSPLRNRHASRAVPPSRFRLKMCRRHIFHTPKPSQVRILLNEIKKKQVPIGTCFFLAAVKGFEPLHTESESAVLPLHNTAMCNFKLQVVLYNVQKAKSSLFFACLKSFGRFYQSRNSAISESGLRTFSRSLSSSAA